jgi:oligopeptide/dipeptide ABC transporter ATP-binding protein
MGVHYQITHKMMIMYAAKAVEYADTADIFAEPMHPYTLMLTTSLPTIGDDRARTGLPGSPPSLWDPPQGCRFARRCPIATELCRSVEPPLLQHLPGRFSACHYAESVPQLKETLGKAPKLSEVAKDPAKLFAEVESALKLDEVLETAVKVEEAAR